MIRRPVLAAHLAGVSGIVEVSAENAAGRKPTGFACNRDRRRSHRVEHSPSSSSPLVRLTASDPPPRSRRRGGKVKSVRVRKITFDHVEHMADRFFPDQISIHGASRHVLNDVLNRRLSAGIDVLVRGPG